MDYPLAYTDSRQDQSSNVTSASADYRTYPMFNERSDISCIMFDGNSPNADDEDPRSSIMLLSTRPPRSIHDPWNQPQMLHHRQQHLLNSNYAQHQPIHHQQIHHPAPHSERGIANFVSKLYQCLQSVDNNPKYARWCQHEGKDMFIIDCIPEFTQFVLPRYFKHCKFPSFVRQLNIYGFQRDTDARKSKDTKDKESCRWYHPCFRPDRGDLFHLIRRKATRYSRKRKTKASNDDDPETILNLGSADESELDEENQENMILIVSNDEHDGRRSSSASSATQSMQPIDYDSTSSQLQLGFQEPVTVTTTTTTTTTSTNSPRILNPKAIPLTVDTNINMPATNDYHAMATPTLVHSSINTHMLQRDDLPPSDNADDRIIDNGLVVNMQQKQQQLQHQQHFEQQQKLHQPLLRGQELRLQLYHMKQHYEKMHAYFKEQLSTAQIQIDEQQIRIQHLEGALGITKQSVKQSTIQEPAAAGGYMSTVCTTMPSLSSSPFNNANYSIQPQRQLNQSSPVNTPRLVPTNHRAMYQMQSNNITTNGSAVATTPRPNNFFFHGNPASSSPSTLTTGIATNNNDVDNPNNPKMIAQIKNEILSSPSTPSTSSNNWLPYHRDSLSSVAIDSPNSNSNNGMLVTAGSDANQSTNIGADNAQLKSTLPSSTSLSILPLNVHSSAISNSNSNSDSNDHHNSSKIDLMGHMNFNTFI